MTNFLHVLKEEGGDAFGGHESNTKTSTEGRGDQKSHGPTKTKPTVSQRPRTSNSTHVFTDFQLSFQNSLIFGGLTFCILETYIKEAQYYNVCLIVGIKLDDVVLGQQLIIFVDPFRIREIRSTSLCVDILSLKLQ